MPLFGIGLVLKETITSLNWMIAGRWCDVGSTPDLVQREVIARISPRILTL